MNDRNTENVCDTATAAYADCFENDLAVKEFDRAQLQAFLPAGDEERAGLMAVLGRATSPG